MSNLKKVSISFLSITSDVNNFYVKEMILIYNTIELNLKYTFLTKKFLQMQSKIYLLFLFI